MDKKRHWEDVYASGDPNDLSWTQLSPSPSIEWLRTELPDRASAIIDIGGGTSTLVDRLLEDGYSYPAVLDLSGKALGAAKSRLGLKSVEVEWIEGDVTRFRATRKFSAWHDRAVFHFLMTAADRKAYLQVLEHTVSPNGKVLLATFSPTGPLECSGLKVMHYDERSLANELGPSFSLKRSERVTHHTPWGTGQDFLYALFERARD